MLLSCCASAAVPLLSCLSEASSAPCTRSARVPCVRALAVPQASWRWRVRCSTEAPLWRAWGRGAARRHSLSRRSRGMSMWCAHRPRLALASPSPRPRPALASPSPRPRLAPPPAQAHPPCSSPLCRAALRAAPAPSSTHYALRRCGAGEVTVAAWSRRERGVGGGVRAPPRCAPQRARRRADAAGGLRARRAASTFAPCAPACCVLKCAPCVPAHTSHRTRPATSSSPRTHPLERSDAAPTPHRPRQT